MTARKVALWAIVLFLAMLAINVAFSLVSSKSDVDVAIGVLILIGLTAACVPLAKRVGGWVTTRATKHLGLIALIVIGATSIGCGCTRIDPGHVGIKVDYYGTDKGVENIPQVTGMVWYNPVSTTVFQYPTFVQTAIWTKNPDEGSPNNEEISFNSKEGLVITGDISLSYQVNPKKVPAFYVKFRSDDLSRFTHGFLRNIARDAFNETAPHYTVEELYGEKKEELLKVVRERINREVEDVGVSIEQFGFIGAPRLPDAVVAALNGKIKATQDAMRVQNELVQTEAEAKKTIARAEGEAKANRALTDSITPTLLEWRRLEITQLAVGKWDGHRPMVEGMGSGMLLNLNPTALESREPQKQ